jgi:hypothetical protein
MPVEERVALAIALALAALATIGQGIQYFDDDYTAFDTGMVVVIVFSTLAGVALVFEADIFPSNLDAAANHVKGRALESSLLQTLLVCGVELVFGEVLFLIGLATHAPGITGDVTVILAPLLVGVLFGGLCCLIGILIGVLIAWPLVKLVQYVVGRRAGKPTNPISMTLALLFLTIIPFAILGVLGSNPPDTIGTPSGRGLYDIVYLYTNYSGTPPQQVMAWIARGLGVVLILEVIWVRRVGHVHGVGANMTVDPPTRKA